MGSLCKMLIYVGFIFRQFPNFFCSYIHHLDEIMAYKVEKLDDYSKDTHGMHAVAAAKKGASSLKITFSPKARIIYLLKSL